MIPISELYKYYEENLYNNVLFGVIESLEEIKKYSPFTPIELKEIGENYLLLSIEDKTFKMRLQMPIEFSMAEDLKSSLLAIKSTSGNEIELFILKCRSIEKFESLDIAYGDEIISRRAEKGKVESVTTYLKNDYVFDFYGKSIIIIETYPNKPHDFTIHGLSYTGRIISKDNKWILLSEKKRKLSRNHLDFLKSSVVIYNDLNFKEESECKLAIEVIRRKETEGSALLRMWQNYSKIEIEKAKKEAAKWGNITYRNATNIAGGITRLELDALEIPSKEELLTTSYTINEIKDRKGKLKSFKIVKVEGRIIFVADEDYQIDPGRGYMSISTLGNERIYERREFAVEKIRDKANTLLTNLYFSIENSEHRIEPPKHRKYDALTQKTRKFLLDEFGIEAPTEDQEEAIRIALNTPDIAIIQGPPGTGKTTVVAAICHRLIEIAEQEKKRMDLKKLVLVSAFQNDTVEHTASKVKTLGLPTIKVGKESVTATENTYADKIISKLKKIQENTSLPEYHEVLKELLKIQNSIKESNLEIKEAQNDINKIIEKYDFGTLKYTWINSTKESSENSAQERGINALRSISVSKESFDYSKEEKNLSRIERSSFIDIEEKDRIRAIRIHCKKGESINESQIQFLTNLKVKYLKAEKEEVVDNSEQIIKWLSEAIFYLQEKEKNILNDEKSFTATVIDSIMKDLENNPNYVKNAIMIYSQGVAATNQYSARRDVDFVENVILEEAARSNPLDLLIPMTKASKRIILIGDQKQLPHLLEKEIVDEVISNDNDADKIEKITTYETSLFQKLQENIANAKDGIERNKMLTKQFRMHSAIGNFISKVYYDNTLEIGTVNQDEFKQHGLTSPNFLGKINIFCNVGIDKGKEDKNKSIKRIPEVKSVFDIFEEIRQDPTFNPELTVGIITFYSSQVKALFDEAKKRGYAEEIHGESVIKEEYLKNEKEKIRIGSVDSFQGKEFDIVILSTVRSNSMVIKKNEDEEKFAQRKYGFLTLENRLNVAFSRAKKMLVVVGDKNMFTDEIASRHVEGLYRFCTEAIKDNKYGKEI